ncbi:MAG: hypothetical protein ACOYT7_01840 [Patescibacteria group bacterium]
MHAYLISGSGKLAEAETQRLLGKLGAKRMEYPLRVIADVRVLSSFTRLSLNQKTAIVIKGAEEATEEALNAFLKNLEEPQENLFYILWAEEVYKILPTIVSRCQVVTVKKQTPAISRSAEDFLQKSVAERLLLVDRIKSREEATLFSSEVLLALERLLLRQGNYQSLAKALKVSQATYQRLKANGNVSLQLANLAINCP